MRVARAWRTCRSERACRAFKLHAPCDRLSTARSALNKIKTTPPLDKPKSSPASHTTTLINQSLRALEIRPVLLAYNFSCLRMKKTRLKLPTFKRGNATLYYEDSGNDEPIKKNADSAFPLVRLVASNRNSVHFTPMAMVVI